MEKEICVHNPGRNRQVIFNAKTNETMDSVEWLDLIGAKIVRIREELFPESQLGFTLLLKD